MTCSLLLGWESSTKVKKFYQSEIPRMLLPRSLATTHPLILDDYFLFYLFLGDKTANKNVEVTMRVCDQSGNVVPVSIAKEYFETLRFVPLFHM
jgi:hypothetical protein